MVPMTTPANSGVARVCGGDGLEDVSAAVDTLVIELDSVPGDVGTVMVGVADAVAALLEPETGSPTVDIVVPEGSPVLVGEIEGGSAVGDGTGASVLGSGSVS
jgi:hypothetical protein